MSTGPHAPSNGWKPREAARLVDFLDARDDGFVHRMLKEIESSDTLIRIVGCKKKLLGPSSWRAVDEPVDCLLCLADGG